MAYIHQRLAAWRRRYGTLRDLRRWGWVPALPARDPRRRPFDVRRRAPRDGVYLLRFTTTPASAQAVCSPEMCVPIGARNASAPIFSSSGI